MDDMMTDNLLTHNVTINGIKVNAVYSKENIRDIFIPLLQTLTDLHKRNHRRILAMLAAPPGAGKSTLLSFLERLAKETPGVEEIQTIGMDGFHRRQEYLLTHTTVRDGREIPMVDIKGSPETFELDRLRSGIEAIVSGKVCSWPVYDRLLHDPVEDALQITGEVIILEGNYLLLDTDGWRDLSSLADYTISIRAEEDILKRRLIARRTASGHPADESEQFVEYSDMYNARLCMTNSLRADLELVLDPDGRYIKK